MSNNIYDILGKLNGLKPKDNPMSTAHEPIYESVDPHGDIMTAVNSLEVKYIEYKKLVEARSQQKDAEISRGEPEIVKLLNKARLERPAAASDTEALAYQMVKANKELTKANAANDEQEKKIADLQDKVRVLPTAKPTAEPATIAQPTAVIPQVAPAPAVAPVAVTAKPNVYRLPIPATVKAPVTQPATAEVPAEIPAEVPVTVAKGKSAKSAKSANVDSQVPLIRQGNDLGRGQQPASTTPTTFEPIGTVSPDANSPDVTPGAIDTKDKDAKDKDTKDKDKDAADSFIANIKGLATKIPNVVTLDAVPTNVVQGDFGNKKAVPSEKIRVGKRENKLMKDMLRENIEMLKEYKEGDPALGIYNYNDMLAKFKTGVQQIRLDFGAGKILALYDYQIYGLLAYFGSDQNQERKISTIENVMSGYDTVVNALMLPKVKQYISLFPEFEKKSPIFKQRARDIEKNKFKLEPTGEPGAGKAMGVGSKKDPGEFTPVQPHPYQQGDGQLEENVGNDNMQENVKTSSILEAVHQVEDKKLRESAKPDFLDLDKDGDTDEPMKKAAKDAKEHEPAEVDSDAVAKRKRLQALKDKQEDERAERGVDDKSSSRFVKGRAYGGSAQKDDEDDLDETQEIRFPKDDWSKNDSMAKPITSKQAMYQHSDYFDKKVKLDPKTGKPIDEGRMKDIYTDMMYLATKKGYSSHKQFTPADYDELAKPHGISGRELAVALGHKKASQVEEVAPPGAKAERMVKHIKKGYSKDGNLSKREKGIAYATAWKAHNKGQVEEGTNFGDTIKNSEGKMTKVKVTEGKDAIRNHPIYTNEQAWDHYSQELAEQEAMDQEVMEAPVVDVQQELDEIAKLAGLAPKMESKCSSCGCADCKCTTLEEAATRKDFRQAADTIKDIEDLEKRKEHAHHYADFFKEQNPRFKREMFLAACGLDECDYNMGAQPATIIVGETNGCPVCNEDPCMCDREREMGEGNEFTKARLDAIAQGSDTFTVGGKTYNVSGDTSDEKTQVESVGDDEKQAVTEDINVSITANGEQDALNLLRKLSGMSEVPQVTSVAIPMEEESVEEERDIELANTPHETVAPINAVTVDAGGGLGGPKKQYPLAANRGANPLEEEKLWTAYESMINDVKA